MLRRKQQGSHYLTVVRNEMFREAAAQVGFTGTAFDGRYRKEGATVVSELLKKGSFPKEPTTA